MARNSVYRSLLISILRTRQAATITTFGGGGTPISFEKEIKILQLLLDVGQGVILVFYVKGVSTIIPQLDRPAILGGCSDFP